MADRFGTALPGCGYTANVQVFARVDPRSYKYLAGDGVARLPSTSPDSTSCTILFTEKLVRCVKVADDNPIGGSARDFLDSGGDADPFHP